MRLVDLTHKIHPEMQVFPTDPKPMTIRWAKRETYGFESEVIYMSTHTGTHIDAPYHFHPDGKSIDEVPLDIFVRDGIALDAEKEPEEYLSLKDLQEAVKKSGTSVEGRAVLIHTGWSRQWGKKDYLARNPGVSKEAARYLVSKKAALVGVDSANIDHPSDSLFSVHNTLLPNRIPIVENLRGLDSLSGTRFRFIALPLKIQGGTGSPVRAVAEVFD